MKKKLPYVLMIITNDTKHEEALFIKEEVLKRGVSVIHLDASIRGKDAGLSEISPDMIAHAIGMTMHDIRALNHEGKSLALMIEGAISCALDFDKKYGFAGIIGIGGAMGTSLATAVMRSFRLGLPKVMISTLASGLTRPYVGSHDIMMVNPVCDINGLNSVNKPVYRNSAIAIAAQATAYRPLPCINRPLILITTLSTTDPCTVYARHILEKHGFEVLVFHTLGNGGITMEKFVMERSVKVVLDLSLVEINDFLGGGLCSAGPDRGKAALSLGVPTIFAPGNLDFFVTGSVDEARSKFPSRRYHRHNMSLTAVRSNDEDLKQVASHLALLTCQARGPVSFFIPLQGFSEHDSVRGHLHEPGLPAVFASQLKSVCSDNLEVYEFDLHINDHSFAEAIAAKALTLAEE